MPRKKPRTGSTAAKPERPRRGPKIDPWDADYLTTNPKSALVEADIIGLLSSPELWESLSKEEREEIDSIFPDHVPRDEDGTISLKWLRYDDDWRHGVRQWQADLGAGRLDPKWQREAAIAMEERAAGAFDKFKEEEFESFWGQKQKIDRHMRAGESFVLKLADLIAAKLFKVGDIWVYSRTYGRGKQERTHVVKDCRITEIGENSLTFAIPPGRLRFARKIASESMNGRSTNAAAEEAEEQETAGASISGESGAKEELNEGGHMIGTDASTIETARSNVDKEVIIPTEPSKKSSNESEVEMTDVDQKLTEEEKTEKQIEVETQLTDPDQDPTEMEKIKEAIVEAEVEMTGINQEPVSNVRPAEESEDVILCTVYNVLALQTKILETDGRIKNPPHFNAWKTFRCQRNNQDMGSLFELREEYYVWKHPK